MLASASPFADLLHRGLGVAAFFEAADNTLGTLLPYDASCWLGLDPATLLPTSHFTREQGPEHLLAVAANEFLDDDVNKFADLARSEKPVGLLSEATRGVPTASKRYREILAPHGYADGDELRAVFSAGGAVRGCVALHRREGVFTRGDVDLVADLGARYLGEGIHRAVLTTALRTGDDDDVPGLILVGPDDTIETWTPAATRLLEGLVDSTTGTAALPLVVAALVAQVRSAQNTDQGKVATARLPRKTGGWHLLYGSALGDGTRGSISVMVCPENAPSLPAAIAASYSLSSREQQVSSLVFQGCSTRDIADRLHISQYTVQDHLKSIFTKVGVRSRRELVARVFHDHYAPRLGGY